MKITKDFGDGIAKLWFDVHYRTLKRVQKYSPVLVITISNERTFFNILDRYKVI